MGDLKKAMEILRREYGINSPEELREAIKKMPKLNISIFVLPLQKQGDTVRDDYEPEER